MSDVSQVTEPTWRIASEIGGTVATVLAVLVALFGQAFRKKFFPPQLTLDLADKMGEGTTVSLTPPNGAPSDARAELARYYHLRVRNTRRWAPASDTRVVLLQVEEPGPDGALQIRWNGDIPLAWRHNAVFPPFKVVGPDSYADLCSVVNGKWLQIHALIAPFNLETIRRGPTTLVVTVQAQSTETNSAPLRVRISWDGRFHPGAAEMRAHMTVEEVANSAV